MGEAGIQHLRELLAGYALTPVSVSGHADLARRAGVEAFKARIAFAATLGVEIVNTGTGHTESAEEEAQFFAFMEKEILPYAAGQGVRIALETHGGLTGTAEDCLRTLQRLNSPWVGINYDPANVIYYRGVRPEADIESIASHVIHVHLKDQGGGQGVDDFPPLGDGDIDFVAILRSLAQVGYSGPFSVELEVKGVAGPQAEDELRLRAWRWTQAFVNEL
jgi:sugar phosphate isomerase/epimerase